VKEDFYRVKIGKNKSKKVKRKTERRT
jgi:hypothetical protein